MSKIIEKVKNYFTSQRKKLEILLRSAKIKFPKVFDSRYNKQFVIVSFIVLLSLITTVSYATFVFLTSDYRAADIRFANLMYSMKIDDVSTKQLSVPANSTEVYEIELNSLNEIKSNYLVYYTSENDLSDVKVEYSNLTVGTGEGRINGTSTRIIRIVVTNESDSGITLNFDVKGGYVYNNLSLSNGQHKIDGIYDEKSTATGDIVLRTYINEKMVDELPDSAEMAANNYVYDEVASGCTNDASITYNPANSNNNLEITDVSGKTECVAIFHTKKDLTVSILANNLLVSEAPKASSGYTLKEKTCNNGATITWNNEKREAEVTNVTSTNTNCVVKFEKISGAETIIAKYSDTNTEGLIKVNQPATAQMQATTEYRYSGSSPKNYVRFNGNELWRIVGVFDVDNGSGTYEKRIKLMRDQYIGIYSWDSTEGTYSEDEETGVITETGINSGNGINQWGPSGTYKGSALMKLLNAGYTGTNGSLYWNNQSGQCYKSVNLYSENCDFTSSGLKDEAKNMFGDAKWYTAAAENSNTLSQLYSNERGTAVPNKSGSSADSVTRTTSWIGKVGLVYLSDYMYAGSNCLQKTVAQTEDGGCKTNNWMHKSSGSDWWSDRAWTITSNKYAQWASFVYGEYSGATVADSSMVFPTIYLNADIKISGGKGTSDVPYELSL